MLQTQPFPSIIPEALIDSLGFSNIMEKKADNSDIQLPPGFRFHPSDEELIEHYLRNKVTSKPLPASVIAEIDLYKYNPWELPSMCVYIYIYIPTILLSFLIL